MTNFYSQCGEDKWIREHLRLPELGVFVDVGAHNGISESNTLHFEQCGWKGVCIEPNPAIVPLLRANRKCTIVKAAVGMPGVERRAFYAYEPPYTNLSGFGREDLGSHIVEIEHIKTLDSILKEVCPFRNIDLMSIDVEGMELEVWQTLDQRVFQPRILIIEYQTCDLPSNENQTRDAVEPGGYELVHKTNYNLIFELKETGQWERLWR